MNVHRARRAACTLAALLLGPVCFAQANDTQDPIGYDRLVDVFGDALPDGRRVEVAQVEPPSRVIGDDKDSTRRTHIPGRDRAMFVGVTFANVREDALDDSGHATTTARLFYGRGHSATPGVERVHLFSANDFLKRLSDPSGLGPARVWNHSWVGGTGARDADILLAFDRAVVARDWVVVAGVANKGKNPPLLSAAFNVLGVGRSDGAHGIGAADRGGAYANLRHRPHLVAPAGKTSEAAPMVASVATLLLDALMAQRPDSPLTPADEGRVVRSALMAGARRRFDRGADPVARAQPDYAADASVRTDNGLDTRFGAGQVDAWRSYHIVRDGPFVLTDDATGRTGALPAAGFVSAQTLGPRRTGGAKMRYELRPDADVTIAAALIWNWQPGRRISPPDLDLHLYDVTEKIKVVALSDGQGDTGEHVYAALEKGRRYALEVVTRATRYENTSFALAWFTEPAG